VKLQKVDIVGLEAAQRIFDRADQPESRGTGIVWPIPHRQAGLGGDQHRVAPALDGLAKYLLRSAVRIHVCRVEQIDAGLKADVYQASRFLGAGIAPMPQQRTGTPKRGCAEAERRDYCARVSERAIVHDKDPWC